jgi:hypothetical protein
VEFDLISMGLRLRDIGTEALTWRDLFVIVRQLPESSALARAIAGPDGEWGLQEQLLAGVLDKVRVLVWQNTADGHKGLRQPPPIPRPGVAPPAEITYGSDAISIDEMADWLGWERQMTDSTPE